VFVLSAKLYLTDGAGEYLPHFMICFFMDSYISGLTVPRTSWAIHDYGLTAHGLHILLSGSPPTTSSVIVLPQLIHFTSVV
jgi:hypothetical protein